MFDRKEWARRYRQQHRAEINARQRLHHARHRDEDNAKQRTYRVLQSEQLRAYRNAYNAAHREQIRIADHRKNANLRRRVFSHYGMRCECCGESTFEFLCIDHIHGGGHRHRKSIGRSGSTFYRWLIKNKFPAGYQVLCHNCNMAKRAYGVCPHNLASPC